MNSEINDPVFGLLRQDSIDVYAYGGQIDFWPGSPVGIYITVADKDTANKEEVMAGARLVFSSLQAHESAIRRAVAKMEQPNYNENWTETSDDELTVDEFAAEMSLEHVSIIWDGRSTMTYTVGERLSDHVLIASVNKQFEVTALAPQK